MARGETRWLGKLTTYAEWLGRYGSAIPQWSNVESSMTFHYNLTTQDIWTMSWRRFVVLFDAIWPRKDDGETEDESVQKFDVIKDWNDLVGSQAQSGKPRELHDYMREMGRG